MAGDMGKGADGKQGVKAGGDCGAHAAYSKTQGPASSKQGVDAKTPYKHR